MNDRDVLLSSWRRVGRALFLGLLLAGQGRLTFHHHVSVSDPARAAAVARADKASETSEATCPICALASHSGYAHLDVPAILQAPSRIEAVASVSSVSASSTSRIRLSARAPPAC